MLLPSETVVRTGYHVCILAGETHREVRIERTIHVERLENKNEKDILTNGGKRESSAKQGPERSLSKGNAYGIGK